MTALFQYAVPTLDDAEQILAWRMKPRVADFMLSEIDDDIEKQRAWLAGIESRDDYSHWLIRVKQKNVGLINTTQLAPQIFTWGYYIGEDDCLGLGGIVPPYLYNDLFYRRGASKITGDVLTSNKTVIAMHEKHGYRQLETVLGAVCRNGVSEDVLKVELTREDWDRKTFYHKYVAEFPHS